MDTISLPSCIKFTKLSRRRSTNKFVRRLAACILCVCFLVLIKVSSAAAEQTTIRIVAIGDSLFAGYGLPVEHRFTNQLEQALIRRGHDVTIFNASVSGDTTSGGLARIDWVLSESYSAVILFLGYNDAFRNIPVANVRENLTRIIENIQARQLPILFVGAKAPRNLGAIYYEAFDSVYEDLAVQYNLEFYPFFLEGVAAVPELNQRDGIHPNKEGVSVIVKQILPYVERLIVSTQ